MNMPRPLPHRLSPARWPAGPLHPLPASTQPGSLCCCSALLCSSLQPQADRGGRQHQGRPRLSCISTGSCLFRRLAAPGMAAASGACTSCDRLGGGAAAGRARRVTHAQLPIVFSLTARTTAPSHNPGSVAGHAPRACSSGCRAPAPRLAAATSRRPSEQLPRAICKLAWHHPAPPVLQQEREGVGAPPMHHMLASLGGN